MKKKEKKNLTFLVCLLLAMLIIFIPSNGEAWYNGNYALTAEKWLADYNSHTYKYYGTHDTIAHKVWDLTIADPLDGWLTVDNRPFATQRTFAYFMLGTEVPDYGTYDFEVVSDLECGGIYLSKELCGFVSSHECYISSTGALLSKGAVQGTRTACSRALFYLKMGFCEAAAYSMGAMMHYISDVVCFPHVLISMYGDDRHKSYEAHIQALTSKPYKLNPNFRLNTHGWISSMSLYPEECTINAAKDTYFGSFAPQQKTANWMKDFWFGQLPISFENDFMQTVEINLNTGVYYGAKAIQWIRSQLPNGIDCRCKQDAASAEAWRKTTAEALADLLETSVQQVEWMVGFFLVGKMMAVFSLVMVSKEEVASSTKQIPIIIKVFRR